MREGTCARARVRACVANAAGGVGVDHAPCAIQWVSLRLGVWGRVGFLFCPQLLLPAGLGVFYSNPMIRPCCKCNTLSNATLPLFLTVCSAAACMAACQSRAWGACCTHPPHTPPGRPQAHLSDQGHWRALAHPWQLPYTLPHKRTNTKKEAWGAQHTSHHSSFINWLCRCTWTHWRSSWRRAQWR